jgi:hypothetical protein
MCLPAEGSGGELHGMGGSEMLVLLSAPRGRINAARMLAHRDETDEAYGIIIRPPRLAAPAADVPAARPRLTVGGQS